MTEQDPAQNVPAEVAKPAKRKKRYSPIWSRENPPPYATISKKPEYWRFVNWLSTFTPYRTPKTQQNLEKELRIGPGILSKWKLMPELAIDVMNEIKQYVKNEKVAEVIHGWVARLPHDGRAADVQLFLEFFTNWARRTMVDVTDNSLSEDEKKMIQKVFKENARKALPKKHD